MNQADRILSNAHVLTMDDSYHAYPRGAVVLRGSMIVAVGEEASLRREWQAAEVVDCGGRVLMPGLVNAHTHVPMTLLRGLTDDRRLDVWLLGYMMPVEREFVSPDFCRLGTLLACAEMIRGGITCFADMYYFEDSVAAATAEAGMRAVCSQTVLKFPTPDAASFEDSLAAARDFIARWKDHALIVPSVAPHAPYTCTPEILQACAALAVEFDVPLHTHLAETAQEVDEWRSEHGMPVIPWVKKQGLFDAKVLAAHCVHVDDGEINTLQHAGAGVAHNPSSNLKLASGFAPVVSMLQAGIERRRGDGRPGVQQRPGHVRGDCAWRRSWPRPSAAIRRRCPPARRSPWPPAWAPAPCTSAIAPAALEPGKRADLILVDLEGVHSWPSVRARSRTPSTPG